MQSGYGPAIPIRWLAPKQVNMYDAQGNIVLCKCGKPAGYAIMGTNAYKALCTDCLYFHDDEVNNGISQDQ